MLIIAAATCKYVYYGVGTYAIKIKNMFKNSTIKCLLLNSTHYYNRHWRS